MLVINVYEAKTQLSRLIEAVMHGEEIVIAKAGKAAARLVSFKAVKKRQFGRLKGKVKISEDFDVPLPEEILVSFEGK